MGILTTRKEGERGGERQKERKRNRPGIVFHSRTPRQKPPLREGFAGFEEFVRLEVGAQSGG